MAKIILGTVQFGLQYGVANTSGKPSFEKVKEILDSAFDNGIDELDTADAYGDSQKVINTYHSLSANHFKIMSKFIDEGSHSFQEYFNATLASLSRSSLDGYYFHRFTDYERFNAFTDVEKMKEQGRLGKFGVSLYSNSELKKVLQDSKIDLIQLPFNVLDNNVEKRELLQQASESGKTIYVRSAFLQGLLLMEEKLIPPHLEELKTSIANLKQLSSDLNLSMTELCLGYLNGYPYIDGIVIGVDSLDQLKSNLNAGKANLNNEAMITIQKLSISNQALLNPANWEKK